MVRVFKVKTEKMLLKPAAVLLACLLLTVSCVGKKDEFAVDDDSGVRANTRNPLGDTAEAIASGQPLFVTNCSNCHGIEGKGDGASAVTLPRQPQDLTSDAVAKMTDGQIFLVLKNGKMRDGLMTMPPIRRLSSEQFWQIIAYARTLRK